MTAFLGIDIGTFETKGVLVGPDGSVHASARRRHGIATPRPGWVEQDPEAVWWAELASVARELVGHLGGAELGGVGVSAIGPCVVATDASLRPLRPALLYGIDTRATDQMAAITARLGSAEILRRAGGPLTTQSAGPKIAWIRDNEPERWAESRWFMTSQSWLVARLTGEVVMDHATAGYFHPLYDLERKEWDVRGCEDFVHSRQLPRLAWSSEIAGYVHADAAEATGIPLGTPVIVGTTDAPAEAVGCGVVADGDLMAMYGSSGYFIRVGSTQTTHPDLWAAPFVFEGTSVLAAGTSTAGTATRWIAEVLGIAGDHEDQMFARLIELAATSESGARGVLALPHFAGERTPFQDAESRGAVVGLGLEHTQGDVARAVLEGIGHSIAEAILTFHRAGATIRRVTAVGGATRNEFIVGTVSTITGLEQDITDSRGAAFGDAFLAALGVGAVASPADVSGWVRHRATARPQPDAEDRLKADHEDYVALYRALAVWQRRRSST